MTKNLTRHTDFVFRIAFLLVYGTSLFIPLQSIGAAPASVQQPVIAPEIELSQPMAAALGPQPAAGGYTIEPQDKFAGNEAAMFSSGPVTVDGSTTEKNVNPLIGLFAPLGSSPAPASSYGFSGGLEIEPISAYNLIVDSNVLSPSSYGPNSATLGAKYCNRSGGAVNDVWAYIGDYTANTPGQYPIHDDVSDASFDTSFPHLATAPTAVDYGDPTRFYALEHESGSTTDTSDASRYIGSLAVNECKTMYWLVSYPRKAFISGAWVDVTGGVKPEDDLWLQYDFWGKVGASTSYYTRYVTMRNEISAQANKIWPNGDNKVPDQYVTAIQQVLGWDTWTPSDPTGAIAWPGETVTSQGIWYDLGNVGAGFDNNYDLVPDRNIWVQPIGDAASYDPGCFQLVKTYGLIIVKLNDGSELLIPFLDQMYFENIPDNNTGAVGLVFYEYIALDGACTAGLTPYQEVASGYDNEKFNGDFGAGIPPLQSQQSNMTFDKNGQTSIDLGGTINYTLTFTLPDVVPGGDTTTTVTIGNPAVAKPLTFFETIPSGLQYVTGSASTVATMTNYTSGTVTTTRLWSIDSGATWTTTEPAGNPTSTSPNNLVMIQWQLASGIPSPASGSDVTGMVAFNAIVPGGYVPNVVTNNGCMTLGSGDGFICDPHTTLVTGNAAITGTVWKDDGITGGVLGNAIQDGTEAGIGSGTPVTVWLYWDNNGDGDYSDQGDFLYTTTTSDSSGNYCFDGTPLVATCLTGAGGLPATSGSARYIIVVDSTDGDIPSGYGPSTPTSYKIVALAASMLYGDAVDGSEPSDFGFAPALSLIKNMGTTGTIYVGGDTITYTIAVTNNLPGSGTNSAVCSYYVWAGAVYPTSAGTPPGGNAANGEFQLPNNMLGYPDEVFSYSNMSNNTDTIGLSGYNSGNLGGNITSVQYVVHVSERINLSASDRFFINTWYNDTQEESVEYFGDGSWEVDNVAQTAGTTFSSGSTGTDYIITRTLDPGKITNRTAPNNVWRWTDFSGNLLELQLQANKGTNNGEVNVDSAGFIITTDGACGGSGSTLNPVPLTDTFDDAYFDFISSDPPVSSSATGILTWNNVGPLYAGQTKIITILMRAAAVGTTPATINTATSANSKFASGLPVNTPVTDTAEVTITANPNTRSLTGRIFDDNNTNGWQTALWLDNNAVTGYDTGDAGIQYIPVDLYGCALVGTTNMVTTEGINKTCQEQGGEWRFLRATSTNSNGDYTFSNLALGYYRVAVHSEVISGSQSADVNQNGTCTTCDSLSNNELDVLSNDTTFIGDLEADTALTRVSFGYNIPSGIFNIGDLLFFDWDGDGVQDAGDEPVSGVTVRLLGADGTQIATDITDINGIYGFDNYVRGFYTVQILASTLPSGIVQSKDPDGTLDGQNTFSLTATDLTKDFAYQPTGSGTIGDMVFKDLNGNGAQSGTELGISGITVELQVDLNDDGTYVTAKTAVTDSSGNYLFTGLPAGTYRIKIDLNNSPYANSTAIPNDAFANDYLPSNGTTTTAGMVYQTKTLTTSTSNDLSADFGFAPPASIGDTVYQDIDGDGTQDLNESGISGVTVTLYSFTDVGDGDGVYDVGEPFYDLDGDTVRDANEAFFDRDGRYQPGDTIDAQVGSTTTTDSSGHYQFDGLAPGYYLIQVTPPAGSTLTGDPNTDGISCLSLTTSTEPPNTICDNRDGMRLYNGTSYMGADFGYQLPGAFGDTVWIDTNGNNKVDVGESGIAEITMTATTTPPNGAVVNGVTYNGATVLTLTTETDANGNYSFQNITTSTALTWTVTVNTADVDFPMGLKNVTDPDQLTACDIPNNLTCTGYNSTTAVLMSAAGAITQVGALTTNGADGDASDPLNLDADFGYRFAGITDISGTVCLESTIDGVCGTSNTDPSGIGAGEAAYDNVTVYLYKLVEPAGPNANNGILNAGESTILVATTLTTSSGDYAFNDVADGTYYIIAIGVPQYGLDLTSTNATVNAGGDGSETGQYKETLAGDGDTLSAFQVINVSVGDTAVVDRDFAFKTVLNYDYGDLPVAYSITRLDDNPDGARHTISSLYLGLVPPDVDGNGYPSVTASNDDNVGTDDEEGVSFTGNWTNGDNGGSVSVVINGSGYLIGWIDLNSDGDFNDNYDSNNDGDFNDTGEWNEYFISQSVTTGTSNFTVDIPAGTLSATPKTFNTRFRLFTTQPPIPALAYTGAATGGEVEDYQIQVTINAPPVVPPHTTPVTLSYFYAQRRGSKIDFTWSTATETANIGFNLYVEEAGQLIQINTKLIPSQVIDSLERHDYSFGLDMAGNAFFIEDVSVLNETRRHGPFQLGKKYGDLLKENKINQAAVQAEHAKSQAETQKEIKLDLNKIPAAALQSVALQPVQNNPVLQLKNTLNLKVRKTGIYRVTYETLKSAGLDLSGVPVSKITLTNRGQIVPVYAGGQNNARVQGKFGPGNFIEFYGEALDTIYTDTNIYTLQVSKSPANRISGNSAAPRRGTTPAVSFTDTLVVNNQRTYSQSAPGGDVWYDTRMLTYTTPKSWNFDFQVTGLANPTAPATLELVVWGVTNFSQNPDHHLIVSLNGVLLADQTFDGLVEQTIKVTLPTGALREGTNTLQLTLPGNTGAKYDLVNLDKFSVNYQRSFQAKDGQLTFTATGKVFNITNLPSSNVIVYRMDKKGIVRLGQMKVQASGSTFSATFAGTNAEAKYLVTTAETLLTPALEATRLQVDLKRPAQYLIISHPDFIDGIQPLVQARQAQGLTVSVVDVTDLYTQYNYGIFDPQAIQKYIAYARKNLGTQYVLLVGGDTYDYRNYLGKNSISFIPSLYLATGKVAKFVPVDPLYADVDGDNVPDLAIGRFPVRTQAELALMVNKTLAYAAKNYGRTAVFASDKYDGVVSFKDISVSLSTDLPTSWSVENIHLDDISVSTAQSQLIAAMNRGSALVTFTGHSGPASWTFSNLFNTQNAIALNNTGRPFVVVQWGCWNTYYVDPVNNYLVQSLLFSGDKGAAAVFGAVTLTDSSSEALLGDLLTPRLAIPGMPMGKALQDAKRELAKTHPELLDVLLGWSLMGDPALVIEP